MKFIYSFLLLLVSLTSWAQKERYSEDLTKYRPVFNVDTIIDSLKNSREVVYEFPIDNQNQEVDSCINALAKAYEGYEYAAGYRIQIYSGTNEQKAKAARQYVVGLNNYNQDDVYLAYRSPNFRVKVGDYLDRLEAYKAYLQLKEHFPSALMVRELKIQVAKLRHDD